MMLLRQNRAPTYISDLDLCKIDRIHEYHERTTKKLNKI